MEQAQVPDIHQEMDDQYRDGTHGGNLGDIEEVSQQDDEPRTDEKTFSRLTYRLPECRGKLPLLGELIGDFGHRTLKRRPPMPWYTLNKMHEDDLRALYRFIRSLGEPGNPAPAYLPPDQEPKTPYALFPSPPAEKTSR